MKKTRINAFVVAAVMTAGLFGGTMTAYAAGMDDGNSIHGGMVAGNNTDISVKERTVVEPKTFEREISVTEGDQEKSDSSKDTVSGAGNLISGSESVGDYISSDVTIGQNASPDLNIDFSMNGGNTGNTGLFTPDGNLTLVDDIDNQESGSLQYMTVQTKNGTTFYIIIDRTTDKDNVYFLNPVDAADLMALMDDDTKAKFQTNTEAQAKSNNQSPDQPENPENAAKEDKNKDSGANPFGTLLIFVVLGGGGAAAYYFFKIKPQKAQMKNDDDDLEFQDDEEYDMEKAEPDDAGEGKEGNTEDEEDY